MLYVKLKFCLFQIHTRVYILPILAMCMSGFFMLNECTVYFISNLPCAHMQDVLPFMPCIKTCCLSEVVHAAQYRPWNTNSSTVWLCKLRKLLNTRFTCFLPNGHHNEYSFTNGYFLRLSNFDISQFFFFFFFNNGFLYDVTSVK